MVAWPSRLHEQADIVVAAEGGGTVSAVAAVLIHRALLQHLVEGHGERLPSLADSSVVISGL